MSVELVFGRSGSGKSSLCIENAIELSKQKKNVYIIVPDQFSHQSEKLLLEKANVSFENSVSVVTFKRLADRIFERSSAARYKSLSMSGKTMLVMRAVYLERKNLTIYKKACDKSGFAKKVCDIISEFKRYGIDDETVRELSEKAKNEMLRKKLADLSIIYKRYNNLISDEYIDSQDDLYLAAALLTKMKYLTNAEMFIDEFSDFLPQHYALLEVILKRAKNVRFYIKYDNESDFFSEAENTAAKIRELCYRFGLELKTRKLENNLRYRQKPDLLAIESQYTICRVRKYTGKCENVSIFESSGMYEEAENLCGKIIMLTRDFGYKYSDICVSCGDLNVYSKILKMCFEMYNIPYFMSAKESAAENPFVKTILAAVNIFIKNYSYESVFLYLKSGFSNLSKDETDILENYVLEHGITKKQWLSREQWKFKKEILKDEEENEEEIENIRSKMLEPLLKLRDKIGSKNSVKTAATGIFEFMCEIGLDKKAEELIEHFKNEHQLFKANMYSKVYNGILNILDQCVLIAGDEKLGMEQFYDMLSAGFENEMSALVPQTADEVVISTVSDARAASCKVMFCLGTNVGEFLSFGGSEGMITDDEREMIDKMGVRLAKTAKNKIADDRAVVYSVITKASDKLFLSYSLSDMEFSALHASPVCEKIKSILENVKTYDNLDNQKTYEYLYASREAAYMNLCTQLSKYKQGMEIDSVWHEIYRYFSQSEQYSEETAVLSRGLSENPSAKPLGEDVIHKLYENGINSSVSRLERYAQCPFSYFVEFTLKAKERKILKLGAPDIGSIMHGILEEFVRTCIENNEDWKMLDEKRVIAILQTITEKYTSKIFNMSTIDTKSNRYLLGRIEKNLLRCAMLIVKHIRNGKFEPVGCEVSFGKKSDIKAAVIDITSGKKLKIHGIIDRVDKFEDETGTYFRVVDYKSGSKDFSIAKLFYGLDLQLALYLKVVCGDNGKPGGMLYFKIKEPMDSVAGPAEPEQIEKEITNQMKMDGLVLNQENVIDAMDSCMNQSSDIISVSYKNDGGLNAKSKVATAVEFERIFKHLKKQITEIGNKIVSGKIDIYPCMYDKKAPCEYCKYNGICRFDKKSGEYNTLIKMKNEEVYENLAKMYKGENQLGN